MNQKHIRDHKYFKRAAVYTRRGKTILFIGSGVSTDVGMPSEIQLIDVLKAEAAQLGINFKQNISFQEATQQIVNASGSVEMLSKLHKVFQRSADTQPPVHQKGFYHLLPAISQFKRLIITTNWDELIEKSLQHHREMVTVMVKDAHLAWLPIAKHAVIKLLGGFENYDTLAYSEHHYHDAADQIQSRNASTLWGYVVSLMTQFHFIFVGYTPEDKEFKLIQQMLSVGNPLTAPPQHFWVAPLYSEREENLLSNTLHVNIIPATATDFLHSMFKELGEFANRLDELDWIFRRESQKYVQYFGHFGCGKTALLDEAEAIARSEEGWEQHQIIRVNWDKDKEGMKRQPIRNLAEIIRVLNDDINPPKAFKEEEWKENISLYLKSKKGIFLIFDAIENIVDQNNLKFLISEVIAKSIKENANFPSKFLLAGRNPLQKLPYSFAKEFKAIELKPLTVSSVYELAYKFLLGVDPDSQERFSEQLINDILEISGGHSQFVKIILDDLTSQPNRKQGKIEIPHRLDESKKKEYVLKYFNKPIDEYIVWDDRTRNVFEKTLCVFRFFNREIIKKVLPDPKDIDLLSVLRTAFVVSSDDKTDPVIRKMKMLYLKYTDIDGYQQAHQTAQNFFVEGIKRTAFPIQLNYICELLYHTLHLLMFQHPPDYQERKHTIKQQIDNIQYRVNMNQIRGGDISEIVRKEIMEDVELRDTLEQCVGENISEEMIEQLIKREVKDVSSPY